jgi:hypothetical protein
MLARTLLCTLQSPILHTNTKHSTPVFLLRIRSTTAHLRTTLVAAEARESRADLGHYNGTLVVHPVARLDAAHAAEAVGEPAAAAACLLHYYRLLWRPYVSISCDKIISGSFFVTESQF